MHNEKFPSHKRERRRGRDGEKKISPSCVHARKQREERGEISEREKRKRIGQNFFPVFSRLCVHTCMRAIENKGKGRMENEEENDTEEVVTARRIHGRKFASREREKEETEEEEEEKKKMKKKKKEVRKGEGG